MSPNLCVLIPAYNAGAFLETCLDSVFAQTIGAVRVIVIDDGSTDDTSRVASRVFARAPAHVHHELVRKGNGGLASARNAGLALAEEEIVAFLDADDILEPGALKRLVAAIWRDPTAKGAFPVFRWMDADGDDLRVMSAVSCGPLTAQGVLLDNPIHADSGVVSFRSALQEVGSFDEGLTGYIGADYWIRYLRRHGPGSLVHLPEPLVRYRRHDAQITADWRRMERNWTLLFAKLKSQTPEILQGVESSALARHNLFCSSLAYKSGEYSEARRRMVKAIFQEPGLILKRPDARIRALACIASLLPEPLHQGLRTWFG